MARFSEWCPELEAALAEPFPPEAHKTMRKGAEITFVSVWDYVARLNALVGVDGWHLMVHPMDAGGKLVSATSLTVLGVTKTNLGDEREDKDDFGTAATNSWAQGLKRTCALFGLGLYLYDEKARAEAVKPRKKEPRLPSGPFKGKTLSELPIDYLLEKQEEMQKANNDEARKWFRAFTDEIERRGA